MKKKTTDQFVKMFGKVYRVVLRTGDTLIIEDKQGKILQVPVDNTQPYLEVQHKPLMEMLLR